MQGNIFKIQKYSKQDGPGMRTVIYFKGCPLRCSWCSHPISQNRPTQILWDHRKCLYCYLCEQKCPTHSLHFHHNQLSFTSETCLGCRSCIDECPSRVLHFVSKIMELDEVMEIILEDRDNYGASGGVTLSGGDAVLQPDFAAALLKKCRENSIHTILETSAFSTPLVFSRLIAHTDLLMIDLKHYDEKKHVQFTGVSNRSILDNLDFAMAMKIPVIARLVIIPGINDAQTDAWNFGKLLAEHQVNKAELLLFDQVGQKKYEVFHIPEALKEANSSSQVNLEEYKSTIESFGIQVRISPMKTEQ